MRRIVTPLLGVGAALLVAALVWPTERMELVSGGATVPLLDIWLWGRVQPAGDLSSTDAGGSFGTLAVLGAAAVLALGAAVLWLRATRRTSSGRLPGTVAAAVVVAALAAAAVGLTAMTASGVFGWAAPGLPTFTSTTVAGFPRIAVGAWAVALLLMVVVLLRRGGAPEGAPGGQAED